MRQRRHGQGWNLLSRAWPSKGGCHLPGIIKTRNKKAQFLGEPTTCSTFGCSWVAKRRMGDAGTAAADCINGRDG